MFIFCSSEDLLNDVKYIIPIDLLNIVKDYIRCSSCHLPHNASVALECLSCWNYLENLPYPKRFT